MSSIARSYPSKITWSAFAGEECSRVPNVVLLRLGNLVERSVPEDDLIVVKTVLVVAKPVQRTNVSLGRRAIKKVLLRTMSEAL